MSKSSEETKIDIEGFTIDFEGNEIWTTDITNLIYNYEYNCSIMCEEYKNSYLYLINLIKYFKIPVLVLSSANSIASIGLSAYVGQEMTSSITCLISFICGLISSIELYLGLQKRIEAEIIAYRSFYLLSIKIKNIMSLSPCNREIRPDIFIKGIEDEYKELFLNSNVISTKIKDRLLSITKQKPILNKLLSFSRSPKNEL
jgi:hypothetical protein